MQTITGITVNSATGLIDRAYPGTECNALYHKPSQK
jgi:hypothetical protein